MLIMASDGVWDYFDNEEVMEISEFVHKGEKNPEQKLMKTAGIILEEAINRGSTDNLSVLVIELRDPQQVKPSEQQGNQHIKILSSISPKHKPSLPPQP